MTQQHSLISREGAKPKELVPFDRDGGDRKLLLPDQVQALVTWAERYDLDPWAGQVILYYGKPYVTERGAMAWARRHKEYRGHALSLVPPQECKAMGLGEQDIVYRCEVFVAGLDRPVVEFGEVRWEEVQEAISKYKEDAYYLPIVKAPGKQARARAIRRAHLLAFPLGQEEPTPPEAPPQPKPPA